MTQFPRSVVLAGPGDRIVDEGLSDLLAAPVGNAAATAPARIDGVRIGSLVGFADDGATPLVTYSGQPGVAAIRARSVVALHAGHMDRPAVLMFDEGDPARPIVLGCLEVPAASGLNSVPGQIEVEADGHRVVVSARNQIVLRCGKASITLTKEGKVLVQGTYVSTHSSGAMRIMGGSVQIN
jgi:hypothetical protein